MKHYIDQVLSSAGVVISGATVTVRVANATPGTGALASIYTVDSTASPISGSAVTTDPTGTFNFYAPDGRYDLTVSVAGATKTVADVEISDITEANSGDATTIVGTLSVTGNSTVGGTLTVTGTTTVAQLIGGPINLSNGSIGLPAGAGTDLYLAGGFGSPHAGRVFVGDGSGWQLDFSKRTSSTTTDLISITDGGVIKINTTSGTSAASIFNDTAGGLNITASSGKTWEFANGGSLSSPLGGALQLNGGTSGLVVLGVNAVVGGSFNVTVPGINDTLVTTTSTDTLTNHRITPRTNTLATSTTFTPNSDTSDQVVMNMTGTAGTLTIAAPTGTPTDGQKLILRIKATNAQTYSFNATYAFSTTVTAPTTLAATKTDYIGCIWDATNTKWDVVAVDQGH